MTSDKQTIFTTFSQYFKGNSISAIFLQYFFQLISIFVQYDPMFQSFPIICQKICTEIANVTKVLSNSCTIFAHQLKNISVIFAKNVLKIFIICAQYFTCSQKHSHKWLQVRASAHSTGYLERGCLSYLWSLLTGPVFSMSLYL